MEYGKVREHLQAQADYSLAVLAEILHKTIYPEQSQGVGGRTFRQATEWQTRLGVMFRQLSSVCEVSDDLPDAGALPFSAHGLVAAGTQASPHP